MMPGQQIFDFAEDGPVLNERFLLYQLSILVNKSLIFIQKQIRTTICLFLHMLSIFYIVNIILNQRFIFTDCCLCKK